MSIRITPDPAITIPALIMVTEIAMRSTVSGIVRLNATTNWSPRASAIIASIITAMVVTLMPPAVEAEPPPINMSTSVMRLVTGRISFISTRLKPPERVMTEAKSALSILSPGLFPPTVLGLFHSAAPQAAAPSTKSTLVVTSVSFAVSVHRLGLSGCCCNAMSTGNPIAPRNTAIHTGMTTKKSWPYGTIPSECGVNPALLNAEIA